LRRTSRLILLLGIFLAALTFIVIIFVLQPGGGQIGGQASQPPTDRKVVVAAVDIPLGTLVTADMLSTQTLSLTVAKPDAFADPSQVIGQTNKAPITAGEQVTAAQFNGGSAIDLVVPPGFRAFPISVNELTGVANLVQVGDYVDVLITEHIIVVQKDSTGATVPVEGISDASTVKMPLLVQDIQVIGTLDATPPAAAEQGGTAPAPSSAPTITGQSKLLILAVTPQQAEVLLFARTSGTIDVVLRAPQDTGVTAVTDGVILKTLIDKYGVIPPNLIVVSVP
jgi:pilus assembly protein CpaB